jgi:hypothetical protein
MSVECIPFGEYPRLDVDGDMSFVHRDSRKLCGRLEYSIGIIFECPAIHSQPFPIFPRSPNVCDVECCPRSFTVPEYCT